MNRCLFLALALFGCPPADSDRPTPPQLDDPAEDGPDTDGDGLSDRREADLGTDPTLADTDDDRLEDGEEVDLHGTDPLDRDTDGGGSTDGAEVLSDATDPLDPDDDVCTFTSVDLTDVVASTLETFDPAWVEVGFRLLRDANGINDFTVDSSSDGTIDDDEQISSAIEIALLDLNGDERCTVLFDADARVSRSVPSNRWTVSDGDIDEAWTIDAIGGWTDCPALDSDVYGTDDIRELLAPLPWGVGLGDLGLFGPSLERAVRDSGDDWDADWAPFVIGTWVTVDDVEARVTGFGFVWEAECDQLTVRDGDLVATDITDGLADGLAETVVTFSTSAFDFSELTGQDCRPDVAVGPTSTPSEGVLANPTLRFTATGVRDGDALSDYAVDADEDGIPEPVSATLTVELRGEFEGEPASCTVVYDASDAVPVDTTMVAAIDLDGTPVEVTRAWRVTLGDAQSDCPFLDDQVYDPPGVVEYLRDRTLTYAIGPTTPALANAGPTLFGDSWSGLLDGLLHTDFVGLDEEPVIPAGYGIDWSLRGCLVRDESSAVSWPAATAARVAGLETFAAVVELDLP